MNRIPTLLLILSVFLGSFLSVSAQFSSPREVRLKMSDAEKKSHRKLDKGDIEGALRITNEAIDEGDDVAEMLTHRAMIKRLFLKDFDGAIADLELAIQADPNLMLAYRWLGRLKWEQKNDAAGALRVFEAAHRVEPKSFVYLSRMAEMRFALSDYAGAVRDSQAAIALAPDNIQLRIDLAVYQNGSGDSAKAVEELNAFLNAFKQSNGGKFPVIRGEKVKKQVPSDLAKDFSPLKVGRYSRTTMNANSWREVQQIQDRWRKASNLSVAFLILGRIHADNENLAEALRCLDESTHIDPNQEAAYALKGTIFLTQKEYAKAVDQLDKAIDIADDPAFYLNRGIAYRLLSDNKKSQKDFDKFLSLYPDGKALLDEMIAAADKTK